MTVQFVLSSCFFGTLGHVQPVTWWNYFGNILYLIVVPYQSTSTAADVNEKWVCSYGSDCIQKAAAGLVFPLASYSKAALLWQHGTDRAQHGLPLALDQADLGPDITSIAAASPLLALCCWVPLMMDRLFAEWSSMAGWGNANLTEAWLTTAAAVVSHLIFMFYYFHSPTSHSGLTALLSGLGGDIYGTVAHVYQKLLQCHLAQHCVWRKPPAPKHNLLSKHRIPDKSPSRLHAQPFWAIAAYTQKGFGYVYEGFSHNV